MFNKLKVGLVVMWTMPLMSCGGGSSPQPDSQPIPVNSAPVLVNPIDDINVEVGLLFQLELQNRFSDEGQFSLNVLEISNSRLPEWLVFDQQRGLIFGVASMANQGDVTIQVTATDIQGLATSTQFTLRVTTSVQPLTEQQINQDAFYIDSFLAKESGFFALGVGVNADTYLTQDGTYLNSITMQPVGQPSPFSAASKESLHLNLLAKAILNQPRAGLVLFGQDADNVQALAISALEKKIATYQQFSLDYPAFGGFLPWFISEDRGNGVSVYPLAGWEDRMPALDNGQWAWSIFLVYQSLFKAGYNQLAEQYQQLFNQMAANAKNLFYDPQRHVIAGISRFTASNGVPDAALPPEQLTYIKDSYPLTDPFEGELMTVFMILFSPDLTDQEKQQLWANKFVNTRDYVTSAGDPLTVVEGWAFSSHEQWKFLVLPYLDHQENRALFLNAEKVRADFANKNQFRGFFASVNTPANTYESLLGIQSVASQTDVKNTVVAPYATYPMLLADYHQHTNIGLQWLANILDYQPMVSEFGAVESYDTSTFAIAPLLTWDGKALTDLAMLGGVVNETREFMIEQGVYLDFIQLLDNQYNVFSDSIQGTQVAIATPLDTPIPVNPCLDAEVIAGLISDFDCQKIRPIQGVPIVENPNPSALNNSQFVGQYNDPSGPWDALVIDYYADLDLADRAKFSIKLMAPVSGILKAKLEGGTSTPVELDLNVTTLDSWVEYQFDFSAHATENHQKLVVFFNAGVTNTGNDIYYIDELQFVD